MKRFMAMVASLAMAVMISGAALAAGPGGGPGKGWRAGQPPTQEQVEQFQQARAKFLKDTMELRQKMAAKSVELRTLQAQPQADQAKIKALALEMVDLRSAIAKKAIEAFSGLPMGRGFGRGGFGPGGCPGFGGGPRGGFGPGMGGGFGPGMGAGPGPSWD